MTDADRSGSDARPPTARRLLLTRSAGEGDLGAALAARGVTVEARPTIELVPPRDPQPVRLALERLDDYDWILFTSPNGVRFFADALRVAGLDRSAARARLAAIGPGTARALGRWLRAPDLVAERGDSEGLAAALRGQVAAGQHALLVRPEVARAVLEQELERIGVRVEAVAFYRNVAARDVGAIANAIVAGRYDIVVFTSPSSLARLLETALPGLAPALRRASRVAIGRVTARALQEADLPAHAVAAEPTDGGLVRALLPLLV